MKYKFLFVLLCTLHSLKAEPALEKETPKDEKELCENGQLKCYQTEYRSYVKCIEKQRSKRNICNFSQSMTPMVVSPVAATQPCTGQSCTYIDTCQGTSCVQPQRPVIQPQIIQPPVVQPQIIQPPVVQPQIVQPQIVQQQSQPQSVITIPAAQQAPTIIQPASPNVTTIIKLTNIVNNTNLVNVTTTLNNTNVNNLELGSNATSTGGSESQDKCCTVVQPRVCHKVHSDKHGYRCVHRRHMTCGDQCASDTVHAQVRQSCSSSSCPPQVAYVPQPSPRCIYQQSWPYVSCGPRRQPSCEGCYDHYGYGFQRYHGGGAPDCSGCYDDGYSAGNMYRQGPFYRPGYYHSPPCYITGSCYMQPPSMPMSCGYGGCYGHELMDPAFGMMSYSPYAQSPYQMPQMSPYQMPQMSPYQMPQMNPYYGASPYSYYQQPSSYYPAYQVIPQAAFNHTQGSNQTDENAIQPNINPYYQYYYNNYYGTPQYFYPDSGATVVKNNATESDTEPVVDKKKKK